VTGRQQEVKATSKPPLLPDIETQRPRVAYPGNASSGSEPGHGYGASIGNKRIMLLAPRRVAAMRLTVTALIDEAFPAIIANFAGLSPCTTPDE
jgi:hypothetical protein